MCSCMKLAGNFLVLIFSASNVLRSSPARLPTYCYGYHLDKYNPVLAAPTLSESSLLMFASQEVSFLYFQHLHSFFLNQFPKIFLIALHLLLWGCSLQFPASSQKASSLLKLQWNWVFSALSTTLMEGSCKPVAAVFDIQLSNPAAGKFNRK